MTIVNCLNYIDSLVINESTIKINFENGRHEKKTELYFKLNCRQKGHL